ncbi:sigma-54 interaction domain-containing protein [Thalassotalea atypica]|uniref:sigma-54 interaction domain-containing protein n=1 Tax=Thalassotalea atypica TaxID=2054316 RepID=UPI002572F70E|nr:sigma 54-interacting transcriptional regulator [Thalassotalea atypica]
MTSEIRTLLSDSQLLLNAVGEGIYGFDTEGKAIFINAAAERLTGWTAQELLGKNIHQYHHHSHADGSPYHVNECKIYATAQDGQSRQVNNEVFWRKDGSSFPVEYTSTPVYHQNKLVGAVAVFRDVTKQKSDEQALRFALNKIQQLSEQLQLENSYLQSELNLRWSKSELTGDSPRIEQVKAKISLVAKTDSTVLIYGENGTGKELAARQIHQQSLRANSAMIKVNCAAFTPSLLESELFGHEKGAFTGAIERRKGKFELAHNGTLFLDEIGELSQEAQSKLLRVIQEQEFERVGGNKTIKVNIRIIAATNRNLPEMVAQGQFRMDLYYRLNVFPIEMPPLRERKEDLPLLSQVIIARLNKKLSRSCNELSQKSLELMNAYQWPGNVRELQNVIEREMILSNDKKLTISELTSAHQTEHMTHTTLSMIEKAHIKRVLEDCNWKIGGNQGAAKILGLPDSTLRSRMNKLGIARP